MRPSAPLVISLLQINQGGNLTCQNCCVFLRANSSAFSNNILPHASFEEMQFERGAYLPFLQKVAESASREKSAGGFSFEQV